MTGRKRQRLFLERHPGYDRQRRARQRARMEAYAAQRAASACLALPAMMTIPVPTRLMLPAPAEQIVIPGMNTLEGILIDREALLVPVAEEREARVSRPRS